MNVLTALPVAAPDDLQNRALQSLGARLGAIAADDGRLVWATAGFAEALEGCERPVEALEGLEEALDRALRAGEPVSAVVSARQARRVYDARVAPGGDGTLLFVELDDAAERHAAQLRHLQDREQLLLTSRVLSVGEMASMLAHELNQPIGSVVNLLRGMKARLKRGALAEEAGQAALDSAIEQALYASGVIARIRTFVDQRQPRVEPLDIADLARGALDLLDWEIRRDGVTARVEAPQALPVVRGDAVMIRQVLVNLARNALDAMRAAAGPERRLTVRAGLTGQGEVELAVVDTGPGVSEEAARRMFEPFYSTKDAGMGVGLSVCRSIVELHGGRLWLTRNSGQGSTFHLALPTKIGGVT